VWAARSDAVLVTIERFVARTCLGAECFTDNAHGLECPFLIVFGPTRDELSLPKTPTAASTYRHRATRTESVSHEAVAESSVGSVTTLIGRVNPSYPLGSCGTSLCWSVLRTAKNNMISPTVGARHSTRKSRSTTALRYQQPLGRPVSVERIVGELPHACRSGQQHRRRGGVRASM